MKNYIFFKKKYENKYNNNINKKTPPKHALIFKVSFQNKIKNKKNIYIS